MDYKKVFKSSSTRQKILRMLDFVPDKTMLKIQYYIKTGRKLNLNNPKRYSEKLQWYKVNYRNELMRTCSDKYLVRDYVEKKQLGHMLNDLYGVYRNAKDIDFDALPDRFVLKASNGGGGNNIIFCDKTKGFDKEAVIDSLNKWIFPSGKSLGREWVYEKSENYIIAEKILARNANNDLPDYKFFCFNCEPYCLYTMIDYTDDHSKGKLAFYDLDFKHMGYHRKDFKNIDYDIPKPENFDKMVEYARILSSEFPHVRVDMYNIDGEIVFGELTFFNASGYVLFEPDEFDFILGEKFILPE